MWLENIFPSIQRKVGSLSTVFSVLRTPRFLIRMNPNESILSLVPDAVGVISKKLLSVQGSRRFILKCSKRFIVLVLTF